MTDDARTARRGQVQRYLLGTLDEAAAAELRAQIIADESVFDEVREMELDLLDDLARGTLDAETRALVESRLLPIEPNRDAWTVAQALADRRAATADAPPVLADPRAASSPGALAPARGTPLPWWRRGGLLAAAASLIAVAGLAFMFWRGSSPGDRHEPANPDLTRPESTTATGAPSKPSSPSSQPAAPASPATSSPAPPAATPGVSGSSPAPAPAIDGVVALYLPAGVLRGARPSVRITPATRTVRIEIEVPSPHASTASAARVALALVEASGREVWTSPGVPIGRVDGQAIATIDVPAASLPSGALEAVISAAPPASPRASAAVRIPFLVLRD